jgi:hypothetical protein
MVFEVRHKNKKSIKNKNMKKNTGVRFEMCDNVTFIWSVLSPCIAAAAAADDDDDEDDEGGVESCV